MFIFTKKVINLIELIKIIQSRIKEILGNNAHKEDKDTVKEAFNEKVLTYGCRPLGPDLENGGEQRFLGKLTFMFRLEGQCVYFRGFELVR